MGIFLICFMVFVCLFIVFAILVILLDILKEMKTKGKKENKVAENSKES